MVRLPFRGIRGGGSSGGASDGETVESTGLAHYGVTEGGGFPWRMTTLARRSALPPDPSLLASYGGAPLIKWQK